MDGTMVIGVWNLAPPRNDSYNHVPTRIRGGYARVRGGFARIRGGFAENTRADSRRIRDGFARVREDSRRIRDQYANSRGFARIREKFASKFARGFARSSRRIRKFADRVREDSRPVNDSSPSLICVGRWLGDSSLCRGRAHRKWCKLRNETSASLTHHPSIRGAGRFDSHWDRGGCGRA